MFVFAFCLFAVNGLKLTRVDVPSIVVMGEPFWLNCSYDLQNEELYSIKWYHWNPDSNINGEFYRWLPKDSPPGQIFDSKGIHLDVSINPEMFASFIFVSNSLESRDFLFLKKKQISS